VFVWRSFYSMRIPKDESIAREAESAAAQKPHPADVR